MRKKDIDDLGLLRGRLSPLVTVLRMNELDKQEELLKMSDTKKKPKDEKKEPSHREVFLDTEYGDQGEIL